jgi:hypothetical protein
MCSKSRCDRTARSLPTQVQPSPPQLHLYVRKSRWRYACANKLDSWSDSLKHKLQCKSKRVSCLLWHRCRIRRATDRIGQRQTIHKMCPSKTLDWSDAFPHKSHTTIRQRVRSYVRRCERETPLSRAKPGGIARQLLSCKVASLRNIYAPISR